MNLLHGVLESPLRRWSGKRCSGLEVLCSELVAVIVPGALPQSKGDVQ